MLRDQREIILYLVEGVLLLESVVFVLLPPCELDLETSIDIRSERYETRFHLDGMKKTRGHQTLIGIGPYSTFDCQFIAFTQHFIQRVETVVITSVFDEIVSGCNPVLKYSNMCSYTSSERNLTCSTHQRFCRDKA